MQRRECCRNRFPSEWSPTTIHSRVVALAQHQDCGIELLMHCIPPAAELFSLSIRQTFVLAGSVECRFERQFGAINVAGLTAVAVIARGDNSQ